MPRYFTLLEAESHLPEVERILQKLRDHKGSYDHSEQELGAITQRVALAGGMLPPRERIAELRAHKDASAKGLKRAVEQLEEIGCLLKDFEIGLVDFPTLYRGQEVYLCWKQGESGITFWHRIQDGFAGRKPIDSEFLSNHAGEQ